ncbi:MAG: hypothetical protein H6625_14070 [Bdellovibrionaceae bacterium]|nr:hypothetical protein [Pseudobdellovibrionaceae bacterium]
MNKSDCDVFFKQQMKSVKKLILLILISLIAVLILLFVKEFPLSIQRSWLLVPTLLIIVFSILGILRLNKRMKYFSKILNNSNFNHGKFKLTNQNALQKGIELLAEVRIGSESWELHVFPPNFSRDSLSNEVQNVEVLLDHEKRPAILKTAMGCLFVCSARLGR